MADRIYSEKEAQEILRIAAQRAGAEGAMSRERLLQAAAEMGIDPAEILAAEHEVTSRRDRKELRERYALYARKEFYEAISNMIWISGLLFGINWLSSGGFHSLWGTWAIWPCGFFVFGALKGAWEYGTAQTPLGDEEFEEWCDKERRKDRVSKWIDEHPDSSTAVNAARMAYAEFGQTDLDHAAKQVERQTRLNHRESKRLVEAVMREELWGESGIEIARMALREAGPARRDHAIKLTAQRTGLAGSDAAKLIDQAEKDFDWGPLAAAQPISTYEVARQALAEVGPTQKQEAIDLVQARTGLSRQEAQEAVEAVAELIH